MSYTKRTWTVGTWPSTVVSTEKVTNTNFPSPPNPPESRDEDVSYYGGHLVCESIGNIEDSKLIAAAPNMLKTLQDVREWLLEQDEKKHGSHIRLIDESIKKATE